MNTLRTGLAGLLGVALLAPTSRAVTHTAVSASHADVSVTSPPRPVAALGPAGGGVTWYVDGISGSNAGAGTSPESAWRDFSKINGRTLAAGDRLLIRRGSVINQELRLRAKGRPELWAEIGAYGNGARPVIRRNWFISDRCTLISDPDYLAIRGLAFSHAGKGLVVFYATRGHVGLLVEDCVAHHIEGLYRPNSSGIPEWRDQPCPKDHELLKSAGIAIRGTEKLDGGWARDVTFRDCDIFNTSYGFDVRRLENVLIQRVNVHDCFVYNTSPHPALHTVRNAILRDCIFDGAGGHAFAGTMGIMVVNPRNTVVRNCTFRNQPDSGSHDQGGIDFEARGDGCMVDGCTFENNAGAAIEVLGIKQPQAVNLDIRNSRFIQNNYTRKTMFGPSEIFIRGKSNSDPQLCCSTGRIRDNGYVLLPGVSFYTNAAAALTRWTLENNTQYESVSALEKAMPANRPPVVSRPGPDLYGAAGELRLSGFVEDDGKPSGKPLMACWEMLEGPGAVKFRDAASPVAVADFPSAGDYLLRLVGDDGELWTSALLAVHILPPGTSVVRAWEFNRTRDKEGWIEADLGTKPRVEPHPQWPCKSLPVMYVAGGYYLVAIEDARAARLISPRALDLPIDAQTVVRIRCQNHTGAERMAFRFITAADGAWDERKLRSFQVTANDDCVREYVVEMSGVPGWSGRLLQLRLDLTAGKATTGTCRIDYIRLERRQKGS